MTEFLTTDTSLPPYMVFPRFLLDMELNETTKLLYMLLLDRARLSLKNEGWTDESGHVFLYFTIESMAEVLHKSQMTVKTSLSALEKQDLILRKRQGAGHLNRIYVKFPAGAFCQTDGILS
ncbi:MAG: replication initiator protein A, partial [Blautia sp.]|nr:replication initiator protein A [Blautia sp.]